tara:strand:+ start:665 stop:859 length:195 start_codon:yes stop_codon:yes gene_type:complete
MSSQSRNIRMILRACEGIQDKHKFDFIVSSIQNNQVHIKFIIPDDVQPAFPDDELDILREESEL